jgi:hypothetical protein
VRWGLALFRRHGQTAEDFRVGCVLSCASCGCAAKVVEYNQPWLPDLARMSGIRALIFGATLLAQSFRQDFFYELRRLDAYGEANRSGGDSLVG